MNRHGYKVRKFGRERDQRAALIRGLASELILNESIETTLPKAKATVKYTEKLITKAKKSKSSLHLRREVIADLSTLSAAHKLVDELSPKLEARGSGYLSIKKTISRRGDNAQMAKITFVDNLGKASSQKKTESKAPGLDDQAEDKEASSTGAQTNIRPEKNIEAHAQQVSQAPKRAGRRGNR